MQIKRNIPPTGYSHRHTGRSMERLSSGYRINSSGDAEGLAIASQMSAQLRGLTNGMRTHNGIALLEDAEAGLVNIHEDLNQMLDAVIQSGTASDAGTIGSLEERFAHFAENLTYNANSACFNGHNLLDGSPLVPEPNETGLNIQFGAATEKPFNITLGDFRLEALGLQGATLTGDDGQNLAASLIPIMQNAIDKVVQARTLIAVTLKQLSNLPDTPDAAKENLEGTESFIAETDMAEETLLFIKSNSVAQASARLLAATNAEPIGAWSLLG